MAGDEHVSARCGPVDGVSIHAHQFHGGRPNTMRDRRAVRAFQSTPTNFMAGDVGGRGGRAGSAGVSIHAHQFHGGRHVAVRTLRVVRDVSIHAHQFHGGRPGGFRFGLRLIAVSIHAHQFHGGRRPECADNVTSAWFQSTPTNFMAGDGPNALITSPAHGFNPRPPISWRATARMR